jgi:hypothetical protein
MRFFSAQSSRRIDARNAAQLFPTLIRLAVTLVQNSYCVCRLGQGNHTRHQNLRASKSLEMPETPPFQRHFRWFDR